MRNKPEIIKWCRSAVRFLLRRRMAQLLPDKPYLSLKLWALTGEWMDWSFPVTYNQKLQWLKLYDRNPRYTMYADKLAVRAYIAETIGEKYLVPMLGVYNHADEIDFAALPERFILKCTHDSGTHVICTSKSGFDATDAERSLQAGLRRKYYRLHRERQYQAIKPRVICEALLGDARKSPDEYKLLCFDGEPCFIKHHRKMSGITYQNIYNKDWKLQDIQYVYNKLPAVQTCPSVLSELLTLARKLSKGIPHIRVDFYVLEDNVYFSELTLHDTAGFIPFPNRADNLVWGGLIPLDALQRRGCD